MTTRATSSLLLACACLAGSAAHASRVGINPVLIRLTREAPTEQVVIANPGTEPIRFELQVFAWSTSAKGEMILTPTSDVVFFPRLFQLGAGETRQVRLGATKGFGAVEKSYRLIVQELPRLVRPGEPGPSGLQVLSRLSLPLFLEPAREVVKTRVEPAQPAHDSIGFLLANSGTVHVRPTAIRARTVDAEGVTLAEQSWDGWYLLAGGQREYRVPLGEPECRKARSIEVSVSAPEGDLRQRVQLPPSVCGL